MLIARVGGQIVGTLTLVTFPIPTGVRAWIEDVVTDESARGKGVATALIDEAIRIAKEASARTVDLSSRPSRAAAGVLYERLGFEQRETRMYRYKLPKLHQRRRTADGPHRIPTSRSDTLLIAPLP